MYLGIKRLSPETFPKREAQPSPAAGDLVLLDALRTEHLLGGNEFVFCRIPCSYLGIAQDEVRHLTGLRVSGAGGVAALVSKFLAALIGEDGLWNSMNGKRLALNAVDVIALFVAELLAPYRSESTENGSEMLARIRSYIEENLMDPDLSPESIARAHHISVRYLHKLFQGDGTTVSTHVRQRRLAACRLDLGRLPNRRRSVAAVAQSWGFASPSHFSRLFRQAYGESPSEWQVSASVQERNL
ncbi:helix-turn-helix domain-containing protein [Streptomyces sp. Ncost-T10-10d]|uniref:helix-turn-helix domain-containing protein n=1 Tax=Streptomyces sp. Ncost-T10-10d TaxID=1839774 RepID=UPI002109FEF2|nr:AraC family transcriptional regulator [Streptomyces sp. Ncost-T10-10d]